MLRSRFIAVGGDPRPVTWPIKHPFWCSGYNSSEFPIVIAYTDSLEDLYLLWPDATEVDSEEVTEYHFTSRFQKPEWFKS